MTSISERLKRVDDAHRNGGLAVIAALAAHGVDTVFGIPGTHNLEFYRHLETFDIRAITPRHEQGAGYGADGYWLLSGKPGVVITTSGPGLTNVITAAATAYAESRPMLILSPGVPNGLERADVGLLHETKATAEAIDNLLVGSKRTRTAEGAAAAVSEAFARFASERPGPIHIEVPLDVLEGPWHGTAEVPRTVTPIQPAPAVIAEAAEALTAAQRPLIIAGGGARRMAGPLTALAEKLDAPLVTTANGKGAVDESHPLSLGASVRFPSVQKESQNADVLLVIGSELADSDLWGGRIGARGVNSWDHLGCPPEQPENQPTQTVIRCDIDPDQLHKNLPGNILVHSDSREFVDALSRELGEQPGRSGAERTADLNREWRSEFPDGAGVWTTRAITAAGGPGTVIAGDSSQVTYDGAVHALQAHSEDQLLYMPGFATLGYGIPAAIGAKLADPNRPVVVHVGDGAAMFSIQEVMTAVELGLGIPMVIVDNGGYAEIEAQMQQRHIDPFAVHLARPNFTALGTAFGGKGVELDATDPDCSDQLERAVAEALGADVPTLIHVRI